MAKHKANLYATRFMVSTKAAITMIIPLAITRSQADPESVGSSGDVLYAWIVASQVVVVSVREDDGLVPHLGTANVDLVHD
jgi:hypothetical protein